MLYEPLPGSAAVILVQLGIIEQGQVEALGQRTYDAESGRLSLALDDGRTVELERAMHLQSEDGYAVRIRSRAGQTISRSFIHIDRNLGVRNLHNDRMVYIDDAETEAAPDFSALVNTDILDTVEAETAEEFPTATSIYEAEEFPTEDLQAQTAAPEAVHVEPAHVPAHAEPAHTAAAPEAAWLKTHPEVTQTNAEALQEAFHAGTEPEAVDAAPQVEALLPEAPAEPEIQFASEFEALHLNPESEAAAIHETEVAVPETDLLVAGAFAPEATPEAATDQPAGLLPRTEDFVDAAPEASIIFEPLLEQEAAEELASVAPAESFASQDIAVLTAATSEAPVLEALEPETSEPEAPASLAAEPLAAHAEPEQSQPAAALEAAPEPEPTDPHYAPLHESLTPADATLFDFIAQTGTVYTYEHRETFRYIHIDAPSGLFYDQTRTPISRAAALKYALTPRVLAASIPAPEPTPTLQTAPPPPAVPEFELRTRSHSLTNGHARAAIKPDPDPTTPPPETGLSFDAFTRKRAQLDRDSWRDRIAEISRALRRNRPPTDS